MWWVWKIMQTTRVLAWFVLIWYLSIVNLYSSGLLPHHRGNRHPSASEARMGNINVRDIVSAFVRPPRMFLSLSTDFIFEKRIRLVTMDFLYIILTY